MSNELKPCVWSEEDGGGPYETSCGHMFECSSDGPVENGFLFCCFCGREIAVQNYGDAVAMLSEREKGEG